MEEDHTHDRDGSHDEGEQQNVESNAKKKSNLKPRGPAKGLKHKPGVVKQVEWDDLDRPVGEWSTKFATHIGYTTRSKVSILIDEWANVPTGLKETLWLDIKKEFQVDEKHKAKVIQKCCLAWNGHKTKLVSGWIECSRPMGLNKRQPYEEYQHITKEVWDEFVKIHSTEEAKEKREKAKRSQSYNIHPHRMGKKSYAQMTPIWRAKGLLPTPSTSSTNSSDISSVSLASERSSTWLLARSKPDEEGNMHVPNENTRIVKDKMDELAEKQRKGEFVPSRLNDILNQSLGKRDRHGRSVLGIGSGVTVKQAFGTVSRKVMKETDMVEIERRVSQKVREEVREEMREELREELRGELREELRDELNSSMNALFQERFEMFAKQMKLPDQVMMDIENNSPIAPQIIRSSCQSGGLNSLASQEENDPKEPQTCQLALFLHNPKERVIVANGLWYPQMRVDHHKPIPLQNVRVSVDKYDKKYGDVPIPVPSGRITKLHQAHGSFVQWPKSLVDLLTNEEIRNEYDSKRNEVASGDQRKEDISGAQRKEVTSSAPRKEVTSGAQRKEVISGAQSKKVVSGHDTKGSFTKPVKPFRHDKNLDNLSGKCKIMLATLHGFRNSQNIKMPYDKNTFLCHDDSVSFKKEDAMEFLTGDSICVSILQVFMMALIEVNVDNTCLDSFGFMCPTLISETMISSSMDECTRYMTKVMQEQCAKRFILCPYHQDNHWILLVLCTSKNVVYVFDSLRPTPIKKRVLSIRIPLCNAFRGYRVQAGHSNKVTLDWNEASCSQQDGTTECGYFVMRYILELVRSHNSSEDLTKVLQRSTPYSKNEIDEVREIWAKYFVAYV